MRYDAIVIGSGVGGMTAAVLLAKAGRRVLVLEQHGRMGGLMQTYRRAGHVFPTGMHVVGALSEGQNVWRYLKYMGVMDRIRTVPLDPDGWAQLHFAGFDFRVPTGREACRDRLVERFPAERDAIDRFFGLMAAVTSALPVYNLSAVEAPAVDVPSCSLADYLSRLSCSRELTLALTAHTHYHSIPPAACPLYVHFLVMDSLLSSAHRIDDAATGSQRHPACCRHLPLAEAFEQAFIELGGTVRCNARVTSIESSDGKVRAVCLEDGERIETDLAIYTGHPRNVLDLCAPDVFRPAYRQRVRDLPETALDFGVALAWKQPHCPLARHDTIICPDTEPGRNGAPAFVYLSALPEPDAGGWSVTAVCGTDPADWTAYAGTQSERRPADYARAKQALAERVLQVILRRWPGAAGHVDVVDTFSPLTIRDLTATPFGGNRAPTAVRRQLSTHTKIKGLHLAGQSIMVSGVPGTVMTSVHACGEILGEEQLLRRIRRAT